MLKKQVLLILVIFLGVLYCSEAKPQKTGVHNYLGTDNQWHYVTTYRDSKTGAEWSSEWVHGEGPNIYHPAILPYFNVSGNGSTSGGDTNDISVAMPCDLSCEFKGTVAGALEIKVDENIEVEIFNIRDGSIFLNRTPITGQTFFQQIQMPSAVNNAMPYGLIAYKNGVAKYMELFFFDAVFHNSMETYSSPGYDVEQHPSE